MFYLLGSLLFVLAMFAAIAVMIANFAHYRQAMMVALRSLSMDGWAGTSPVIAPQDQFKLQAGMTLRMQQAVA